MPSIVLSVVGAVLLALIATIGPTACNGSLPSTKRGPTDELFVFCNHPRVPVASKSSGGLVVVCETRR